MKKNQVEVIEQAGTPMVVYAKKIEITSAEKMTEATHVLSELNKFLDKVTEEKEKVTKPLNAALKAERERWKPVESEFGEAIDCVRAKMTTYQNEKVRAEEAEKAKIAARVGEGKGKLKIETAVRKIGEVEVAEKNVTTESGAVRFKTVKRFEIVDTEKIPRAFLMPNEELIKEAMKEGKEVAGVRFYEDQVPVNFR